MCHTGTSNGGKKWRMVLFQVDPYIESPWTSIYCKFKVMQVIFYISHNSLKKSEIFIWRLWLPLLSLMGLSLSFAIGGNGQGCLMAIQYRWMSLRRGYHIRSGTVESALSAYRADDRSRQLQTPEMRPEYTLADTCGGGDCLKSKSTPSEDWKFVVAPV